MWGQSGLAMNQDAEQVNLYSAELSGVPVRVLYHTVHQYEYLPNRNLTRSAVG